MADLTAKQRSNIKRAAALLAGQGNKKLADSLRGIIGTAPKRSVPVDRALTSCAAGRDGDCTHANCPQFHDKEPATTGRHCPLDNQSDED